MANIHLTMATLDYDHVRDLASGEVRAPGIDLTCFNLGVEEIFYRFLRNQEWDISEVSMGMSTSAISPSRGLMPTASTNTRLLTTWGHIAAISAAIHPPMENPMMCTCSPSFCSRRKAR